MKELSLALSVEVARQNLSAEWLPQNNLLQWILYHFCNSRG
jgi:hypothetical protein